MELIEEAGHAYPDTFRRTVSHLVAANPSSGSRKLQVLNRIFVFVGSGEAVGDGGFGQGNSDVRARARVR